MRGLARLLGRAMWWFGWPAMWLYLRDSERTRLVLVNEQGKILVTKGWISGSDRWSLPGGGLHRGEDPVKGLLREVHEEVGLTLQPEHLRQLAITEVHSKGFRFKLHIYGAAITGEQKLRLQWFEISEARWIGVHELTPQNTEPDVLRALQLMSRQA